MNSKFNYINPPSENTPRLSSSSKNRFLGKFKPGDIFTGKVIEILSDSKFLVKVRGTEIIAESNLLLQSGNVYRLQVQTVKPKFSISIYNNSAASGSLEEKAIEILTKFDLNINRAAQGIVEQLIKYGFPVSRETVLTVMSYLREFAGSKNLKKSDREKVDAILFLIENDIPVNEYTFSAIKNIFEQYSGHQNPVYKLLNGRLFDENLIEFDGSLIDINEPDLKIVFNIKNYLTQLLSFYDDLIGKIAGILTNRIQKTLSEASVDKLLFLFKYLLDLKLVNTVDKERNDFFYVPTTILIGESSINIEILYKINGLPNENNDKLPDFTIHLLIRINESAPLHVKISKKAPRMINIIFKHPVEDNMELLRNIYPLMRHSFRQMGFVSVNITDIPADTYNSDYLANLFLSGRPVRSINITG